MSFLLLARGSAEEKGTYRYVKEIWPVSRSVEGWEEGFAVFIYTPAFDVS